MTEQISRRTRRILSRLVAILGTCLALGGAWRLDVTQQPGQGYALLLSGALLLVLLPEREDSEGEPRRARPSLLSIGAPLVAGLGLTIRVVRSVLSEDSLSGGMQLGLWFAAGLLFVVACHLWDLRRNHEPRPRLFARADLWWMFGLFLVAAAARLHNLAVEPPGLASDELWPLEHTLGLKDGPGSSGFTIDYLGQNGLFHRINLVAIKSVGWVGFDMVQAAKLPGALFGALSVAFLFATVRLLGGRTLAATAGVFLLWQGLHWSLSRVYYMYAGDLLWISLTTLLLVSGLRSNRLSLLAAAGFTSAVAANWLTTSMLVAPWAAVILADDALIGRRQISKRWLPASVWLTIFAVAMLPMLAEIKLRPTQGRYAEIARTRKSDLQHIGMNSAEAYARGFWNSARVLQVEENNQGRHPIRRGKPSLDPVASAMGTVGLIACGLWLMKHRGARLCLLGLLLFVLPAVGSYPAESDGQMQIVVSRRLAGATLFIGWLAAYGASVVAKRLAPARRRLAIMLLIAFISLLLNVHYIRAFYGRDLLLWYEDMGINRVYVLRALRKAAQLGPVYFAPVHNTEWLKSGLVDLPNVFFVNSPPQVREGLKKNGGRMCSVLLPWPGPYDPPEFANWVPELSDVIPISSWESGPPDPIGVPVYRIAYVWGR